MKIRFHGPLGEVTGSCYELRDEALDVHFLVDYGMKQGKSAADGWNEGVPEFEPKSLDFVLLTHAHLDHCGLIPALYKQGFRGPVICTRETAELARIGLRDACKHGAPYDQNDIDLIQWLEPPAPVLGREHELRGGLSLTLQRTGHILGSTSMMLRWGPANDPCQLLFSGDIGNNTRGNEFQPLMRYRQPPPPPQGRRSYVVMESTYGGKTVSPLQKNFDVRIAALEKHVEQTVIRKEGTLIIPCFAIGRTQSVLFDLHYLLTKNPRLRDVPILFDAGMARRVNSIYAGGLRRTGRDGHPAWLSEQLFRRMGLDSTSQQDRELLGGLLAATFDPVFDMPVGAREHSSRMVRDWVRRWRLTSSRNELPAEVQGPSIVVTGGGMCDGGPVVNYLSELLFEERNKLLLTGYCSPRTVGGKLLQLRDTSLRARSELSEVLRWDGSSAAVQLSAVRADISSVSGYSGHADHDGLLDWFFQWRDSRGYPAGYTAFLTHGEEHRRQKLAQALRGHAGAVNGGWEHNFDVQCPTDSKDWFDLDRGGWIRTPNSTGCHYDRAAARVS